jgi:hypothetical protein
MSSTIDTTLISRAQGSYFPFLCHFDTGCVPFRWVWPLFSYRTPQIDLRFLSIRLANRAEAERVS